MVVIIVLLTFLALITIDWIRTRKKVKALEASATSVSEPVGVPHPQSAGGIKDMQQFGNGLSIQVTASGQIEIAKHRQGADNDL
ncbi:MAG: hypothetical protein HYR55_05590 [Acidobacteria bacterium]|nr:hypothetical protein [Acidobacteriota bacterium]MBI3656491.1 hypothetical protein [Acidobacteriota bacterium]